MSWWNKSTASALQFFGLAGLVILASRDVDRTMRANDQPVTPEQTRELANDVQTAKWFK